MELEIKMYDMLYPELNEEEKYQHLSLIKALHKFGWGEYHQQLDTIEFHKSIIKLTKINDLIIVIFADLNEPRFEELCNFNQLNEEFKNVVDGNITMIPIYHKFILDRIIEFNYGNYNECVYPMVKDTKMLQAYICEPSAIPISSVTFQENQKDELLVVGLLTAMNSFSNIVLKKDIETIKIGDIMIFFQWRSNKLYMIVREGDCDRFKSPTCYKTTFDLLNRMGDAIDMIFDFDEKIAVSELNSIMETVINESEMGMKYHE
ncbi:MAG: hypothetical protein INQ03_16400 [Candidatus Heimdallarchaeota archaeon]|nr:hypothetical protein [Candidatus Heimdallarchaeota archaeon]